MKSERGHAMVFVAMFMAVMAFVAVMVAHVAGAANTQAQAQTAADAAALAAVQAGRQAAEVAADRNGAKLMEFAARGSEATVAVQIGDRKARASAAIRGGLGSVDQT